MRTTGGVPERGVEGADGAEVEGVVSAGVVLQVLAFAISRI